MSLLDELVRPRRPVSISPNDNRVVRKVPDVAAPLVADPELEDALLAEARKDPYLDRWIRTGANTTINKMKDIWWAEACRRMTGLYLKFGLVKATQVGDFQPGPPPKMFADLWLDMPLFFWWEDMFKGLMQLPLPAHHIQFEESMAGIHWWWGHVTMHGNGPLENFRFTSDALCLIPNKDGNVYVLHFGTNQNTGDMEILFDTPIRPGQWWEPPEGGYDWPTMVIAFLGSKAVERRRTGAPRSVKRQIARERKDPGKVPDVQVIRLREIVAKAEREYADSKKKGSKQRLHWRSAHWKQQPHGPGRKLRKPMFIEAYMAGSGEPVPQIRVVKR